ncbi:MAG: ImmA/IrrE family metallo-endopeptidase [Subtercola sp.]|nr:ImmA/IrrE family metallo-endopeptidase [Subtercola sp.]
MNAPYTFSTTDTRSVLATLRSLIPNRHISFGETLQIIERQATKFLEIHDFIDAPIPIEIIGDLPRIRIVSESDMPISGSSAWDGQSWLISLNATESWARRRFTLAHEYLHIVHHGFAERLYSSNPAVAAVQAEQAADYFAGCLLVPKRLLKSIWCNNTQDVRQLSQVFDVSAAAIRVRLNQTGLIMPVNRCENRPVARAFRYHPRSPDRARTEGK